VSLVLVLRPRARLLFAAIKLDEGFEDEDEDEHELSAARHLHSLSDLHSVAPFLLRLLETSRKYFQCAFDEPLELGVVPGRGEDASGDFALSRASEGQQQH